MSFKLRHGARLAGEVLEAEVLTPSHLDDADRAAWTHMLAATPDLRRAFFAPGFALACERAGYRVRVGVLRQGGATRGFLPFQFASSWHERLGLAERVGDGLCDNAGLIAEPGFTIDPIALLRRCGINRLFITHLAENQEAFGLTAEAHEVGHRIDLPDGSAAYFAALAAGRRGFVQDTQRRLRRAERDHGALRFACDTRPELSAVRGLIARKRDQFRRTGAEDMFDDRRRQRLIEALLADSTPDCRPVMTMLFAGERLLASHLGLLHHDVLSYWFPVYDPEAQKVSPGRLLLWHTLQQAEALGLRLIDRGAGDSEAKRDFSTATTRFGCAAWSAGTLRAGVARLWQSAEWRLAAWREAR